MPDYADQYPDYFSEIKKKKAEPFVPSPLQDASVGHRNARVRISRVKPSPAYLLVFLSLTRQEKKQFYIDHIGRVPCFYKYGVWGRVCKD